MSVPLFSSNLTVAETLQQKKETSRVFIARRTACIGCYLARFCTLEDVAKTYGFSLADFMHEMQSAAQTKSFAFTGAQDEK
jgi:hypothetical protein